MDSKFYVSYDAAMLLKEKGYNEKCTFAYAETSNGSDINGRIVFNSNDYPVGFYPCPTKAEVIDWLEDNGLVIEVTSLRNRKWRFSLYQRGFFYIDSWIDDRLDFPTRLEAEDAAIIKACELL